MSASNESLKLLVGSSLMDRLLLHLVTEVVGLIFTETSDDFSFEEVEVQGTVGLEGGHGGMGAEEGGERSRRVSLE